MSDSCKRLVVAIDGPAGAGKSTVARKVADELGYAYIDTGAMYRSVAWLGVKDCVMDDEATLVKLAEEMDFHFVRDGGIQHVMVNGEDITEEIRSPRISNLASPVSAIPGVRRHLSDLQRRLGRYGGVVMEGRDIGTVVFPDAEVKVFLTASAEERARRRWLELQARGVDVRCELVLQEIEERDLRDSSRDIAPLKPAADAVIIDTDGRSIDEVVGDILSVFRRAAGQNDSL